MVSARSVSRCPAPVWPSVQPLVSVFGKLTHFPFPRHMVASVNISSSTGAYNLPCAPVSVAPTSPGTSSGWKHTGVPLRVWLLSERHVLGLTML